jgi:excisionase family DNA binding protein
MARRYTTREGAGQVEGLLSAHEAACNFLEVLPNSGLVGETLTKEPLESLSDAQIAGNLRPVQGGAKDLLTVREVAARLSISTAAVYALCDRGELPHVRVSNAIRVAPADLEAFIARGRSENAPTESPVHRKPLTIFHARCTSVR